MRTPQLARAALLAGAAALAPPAQAAAPLCRVEVVLEPSQGLVGEQVLYRLRIERHRDVRALRWERNLSFPAFRAEWLPGSVAPAPSPHEGYQVFEERRALFPARPGELEIPEAGLLCRGPAGEERVAIPAARLPVREPPEAGRPEGWQGLVGPVEVFLNVVPDEVVLGQSVRVAVVVQGPANVWDAPPPLAEGDLGPDVEVFSRPRRLARDAGRRLAVRRYFTYDLVPRRAGRFEVPPIRLASFDPALGRYAVSEAPGQSFTVTEAPPPRGGEAPSPARPGERAPAAPAEQDAAAPAALAWLAAAAGCLALAGVALLARRARGARATGRDERQAALAEAEGAEHAGEVERAAAALARALRLDLEEDVPGARALSSEELAARARGEPARARVALLERLDRVRFAREGSLAEIAAVRAALGAGDRPPRDAC